MKRLLVLFFIAAFFVIGACDKKAKDVSESDTLAELLKENNMTTSTNTNLPAEENITEEVVNTNIESVATQKVESPAVEKEQSISSKMEIKDEGIEIKKDKKAYKSTKKEGTLIIIGNDESGQTVSPRKFLKLTLVVTPKSSAARRVNFYVYAMPKNSSKSYLVYNVNNIEVINGQAQLTKFWNARNANGGFLDPGEYNIYVKFVIKDKNGYTIDKIERYWGSKDFYIKLY